MDSLIKVNESASQIESVAASVASANVVPCFTVSDLVHAYGVMSPPDYRALFQLVQEQVRVSDRVASFSCGALRVASSKSSGSDRSNSDSAGSFTGQTRLRYASSGVKRAASWRKKVVPDGMCYARLLRDGAVESVSTSLGVWPTVASLLQQPADHFRSLHDLGDLTVSGDESAIHVIEKASGGQPALLPAMARVAQGLKTAPGSFGAVLRASGLIDRATRFKVTARTAVGGFEPGDFESRALVEVFGEDAVSSVRVSQVVQCDGFVRFELPVEFFGDRALYAYYTGDYQFKGFQLQSPSFVPTSLDAVLVRVPVSWLVSDEELRLVMLRAACLCSQRRDSVSLAPRVALDSSRFPLSALVHLSRFTDAFDRAGPVPTFASIFAMPVCWFRSYFSTSAMSLSRSPGDSTMLAFSSEPDCELVTPSGGYNEFASVLASMREWSPGTYGHYLAGFSYLHSGVVVSASEYSSKFPLCFSYEPDGYEFTYPVFKRKFNHSYSQLYDAGMTVFQMFWSSSKAFKDWSSICDLRLVVEDGRVSFCGSGPIKFSDFAMSVSDMFDWPPETFGAYVRRLCSSMDRQVAVAPDVLFGARLIA
nr:TPA_asm: PB protein [Pecan associated jivivirus 1]